MRKSWAERTGFRKPETLRGEVHKRYVGKEKRWRGLVFWKKLVRRGKGKPLTLKKEKQMRILDVAHLVHPCILR